MMTYDGVITFSFQEGVGIDMGRWTCKFINMYHVLKAVHVHVCVLYRLSHTLDLQASLSNFCVNLYLVYWDIELNVCISVNMIALGCVRMQHQSRTTFLSACGSVRMCVFACLCVSHIAASILRAQGRARCTYPWNGYGFQYSSMPHLIDL